MVDHAGRRIAALVRDALNALTALSLYGLLAYAVVQHTAEVGIRIGHSTEPCAPLRMILARGRRQAAAGIRIGLPTAWSTACFISTLRNRLKCPGRPSRAW
jgi:hypothetical protein